MEPGQLCGKYNLCPINCPKGCTIKSNNGKIKVKFLFNLNGKSFENVILCPKILRREYTSTSPDQKVVNIFYYITSFIQFCQFIIQIMVLLGDKYNKWEPKINIDKSRKQLKRVFFFHVTPVTIKLQKLFFVKNTQIMFFKYTFYFRLIFSPLLHSIITFKQPVSISISPLNN